MSNIGQNKRKGFTLLETLIAVLIFGTALTALMVIVGRGITAGNVARDQIIAHYLAQEGVEFVRNIRDTNFIEGALWDDGLGPCVADAGNEGCKVDSAFSSLQPCGPNCGLMHIDVNGVYRSDSTAGTETPFERIITVTPASHSDEILVSSRVIWNRFGIPRVISVQTSMLRWR